jgi:hypothetical protein
MSFEIAMQALLADANRWDAASDRLSRVSTDTGQLYLSPGSFSFAGGDAHSAYEEVREFVRDLTSSGSGETSGAAQALREVHQYYRSADQSTRDEMQARWQWL